MFLEHSGVGRGVHSPSSQRCWHCPLSLKLKLPWSRVCTEKLSRGEGEATCCRSAVLCRYIEPRVCEWGIGLLCGAYTVSHLTHQTPQVTTEVPPQKSPAWATSILRWIKGRFTGLFMIPGDPCLISKKSLSRRTLSQMAYLPPSRNLGRVGSRTMSRFQWLATGKLVIP